MGRNNVVKSRRTVHLEWLAVLLATQILAWTPYEAEAQEGSDPGVEATLKRLNARPVPDWFHDAKFGIFIHWTLSAVPAFAPQSGSINDVIREHLKEFAVYLPYAEWYANAMKVPGSPTARYHAEHYGVDTPYEKFREPFEEMLKTWDPDPLADLIQASGARYVVHVTKHHDGYCFWPTQVENPKRPGWHSSRDVVGDLAQAVRERGLRFGVYYSGGLDWSYNAKAVVSPLDVYQSVPRSLGYRTYVDAHFRELIKRYAPDVLWNDIAYPPGPELVQLWSDYYDQIPTGVINDRWAQPTERWDEAKTIFVPPPPPHYGFATPEYRKFRAIRPRKWEMTRGIGHSYGYARNEDPDTVIGSEELIHLLIDVVSKNGNLLLNIGPRADGSVEPSHVVPLKALGAWLAIHGESIYGTRPWQRAEGVALVAGSDETIPVRFTAKGEKLYAILLGTPAGTSITLKKVSVPQGGSVSLSASGPVQWTRQGEDLEIQLEAALTHDAAHVVILSP